MITLEGNLPITSPDQVNRGIDWAHSTQVNRGIAGLGGAVGSVLFNNVEDPAGTGRGLIEEIAVRLTTQEPPMLGNGARQFVADLLGYIDRAGVYAQPGFRSLGDRT